MKVVVEEGDRLVVELGGTDGEFVIHYDVVGKKLTVSADMPDSSGREGVIYLEDFSQTPDDRADVGARCNSHHPLSDVANSPLYEVRCTLDEGHGEIHRGPISGKGDDGDFVGWED